MQPFVFSRKRGTLQILSKTLNISRNLETEEKNVCTVLRYPFHGMTKGNSTGKATYCSQFLEEKKEQFLLKVKYFYKIHKTSKQIKDKTNNKFSYASND